MNTARQMLLLGLILISTQLCAEDLSQHVYFKHLVGKWQATGELKGKDGNVIKLSETWEGKATPDGRFTLEGKRELNDDKQSFVWTITRNPATQTFEVVHVTNGEEGNAIRFEGNVSEVNLTMELRVSTGTNGSITIVDTLKGDAKDEIESKVTFVGDDGEVSLEGTVTHKHAK